MDLAIIINIIANRIIFMVTDIKKMIFIDKEDYLEIALDKNFNDSYLDLAGKYLKQGFKIVHIVNINLSDNEFLYLAQKLRQLCSFFNSLLFVSNRADVVKIVEADGIVLDKNAIPYEKIKKVLSSDILIGSYLDNTYADYDFILSDVKDLSFDITTFTNINSDKFTKIYKKASHDNN